MTTTRNFERPITGYRVRTRRRRAAIVLTVAFSTWAMLVPTADASGLSGMMGNMYTQVSKPGLYQSQSRMGLVGGSFTMRVKNDNIKLINFSAPYISVGCGNIDMFGGSFGFINKNQLTEVFRKIPQIAAVALFRLGIKSLSEKLDGLMAEFGKIVGDLNRGLKDTCQLGESIAADIWAKRPDAAAGEGGKTQGIVDGLTGKISSAWGSLVDTFGADNPQSKQPPKDLKNKLVGNRMWRSLVQSSSPNKFTFNVGVFNRTVAAQLAMNITGSAIFPVGREVPSGTDSEGAAVPQQDPPGLVPTMSAQAMIDLMEKGDSGGFTYTGCADSADTQDEMACLATEAKTLGFDGMLGWVNEAMFGTAQPGSCDSTTGGIVGYILGNPGVPAPDTGDGLILLNSTSIPIMRNLLVLQKLPAAVCSSAEIMSRVVAQDLTYVVIDQLVKVATDARSGGLSVPEPPDYSKHLKDFTIEYAKLRPTTTERIDATIKMTQFVGELAQSLPGGITAMAFPPTSSLRK